MTLFSKKYSKIFMLLGSFCSNMIFTNSSYSMMMDSCKIDDWSQRQHYVERLKSRVYDELSYPTIGLFALLAMPLRPMTLPETRENAEENLERKKINKRLKFFEEVSSAIVGTEMKGNPRSYIQAFRALILNGEKTPEISRRRPYMVYFLRDNSEYWQDKDLAWNLLAPFRNLKDQEEQGYDVRLNFMLSMAEDIFSPLWQRDLALSYIEMEYEQEGRIISYKERGRIDEVKRNFKTDASSSPEAIFHGSSR